MTIDQENIKRKGLNYEKLYLANPYGFSKQTNNLLTEFVDIFNGLDLDIFEPFERTKHLIKNENNWYRQLKNLSDLKM